MTTKKSLRLHLLAPLALVLVAVSLTGCPNASAPAAPPPPLLQGAVNQFDQDSYRALVVAQASIEDLNKSYKANPTQLASLKGILDQAAQDYSLAELTWQTYHAAAAAGQATAAQQSAVSSSLSKVQGDISSAKVTP